MPSVKNEDVRLARTTEAIQIIKKLWERSKKKKEEDNSKNSSFVDFDGQYFKIKNAKLYTPPSSEKIPLYMAISRFANRTYRSFTEARAHTHTLHLDSTDKWFEYCRSGNKPDDIPAYPDVVYEDEWIGWPDWLGYEERKWNIRRVKELIKDMIEHNILDDMSEDERIA